MKTVTYPLRLADEVYERIRFEAQKRHKKLSETFRDVIDCGLEALPPVHDFAEAAADTWEQLGPAPKVLFDKLPPENDKL